MNKSKFSFYHNIRLQDFFDACDEVADAKEVVVGLIEENERLVNELNNFKGEVYKDKELNKLKNERDEAIEKLYCGFGITREERDQIEAWVNEHQKICRGTGGAIGGKYTYEFTPTGIGVVGTIKCACGKSFCFKELG